MTVVLLDCCVVYFLVWRKSVLQFFLSEILVFYPKVSIYLKLSIFKSPVFVWTVITQLISISSQIGTTNWLQNRSSQKQRVSLWWLCTSFMYSLWPEPICRCVSSLSVNKNHPKVHTRGFKAAVFDLWKPAFLPTVQTLSQCRTCARLWRHLLSTWCHICHLKGKEMCLQQCSNVNNPDLQT